MAYHLLAGVSQRPNDDLRINLRRSYEKLRIILGFILGTFENRAQDMFRLGSFPGVAGTLILLSFGAAVSLS